MEIDNTKNLAARTSVRKTSRKLVADAEIRLTALYEYRKAIIWKVTTFLLLTVVTGLAGLVKMSFVFAIFFIKNLKTELKVQDRIEAERDRLDSLFYGYNL